MRIRDLTRFCLSGVVLACVAAAQAEDDWASATRAAVLKREWKGVAESAQKWKQADASAPVVDWLLGYAGLATGTYRSASEGFERLGDPETAAKLLAWAEVLAKENPGHATALMLRGDALARDGQSAQAVLALTEAARLNPQSALIYNVRGVLHALAGEVPDAYADLERAIELDPKLADAYASVGLVQLSEGSLGAAVESLTWAVELAPDFALGYNARGVAYAMIEAWDEAEADFKKASELAPALPYARHNGQFVAWTKAQLAFREQRRGADSEGRGGTLIAQSYEYRSADLGGGRTVDVFIIKATPHTRTLEGMTTVIRDIAGDLRTRNGLPESWQPRLHMDVHGWRSTPYAEMPYAAAVAQQAGADAVIALDVSPWYKYPSPGAMLDEQQKLTWHENVTQAAGQAVRANAAINAVTGIKPSLAAISGGSEVIPRIGEMMTRGELPADVTQKVGFGNIVLAGYPFHKWAGGDVSIPDTVLERVDGKVYNLHTTFGHWSNTLATHEKVANIVVTDIDGRAIPHGGWNDPVLRGRTNPVIDIAGGALRGWQPDTVQQTAERLGRRGEIPTYSTSLDRPLTEAVTMASMTSRALRWNDKVLIGSADAERADAMQRTLKGGGWQADWRKVTDPGQLQNIAKTEGYSRILLVKSDGIDDVSASILNDAQRLSQAPLPSLRPLLKNIDRFNEATNLLYKLADKEMPPEMKLPLGFTAPLIEDLRSAHQGHFNPLTSETLERFGRFGMKELPKVVDALKAQGKLPATYNLSPLLHGVPEIVAGGASQFGRGQAVPNVEEITSYLDGVNKASWATVGALVGGPKGAAIVSTTAGLTADVMRGATEPIFQYVAHDPVRKQMVQDFRTHVEAAIGHGVQAKTFTEMFTPQLIKQVGFNQKTAAELDSYANWANASRGSANLDRPIPIDVGLHGDDSWKKVYRGGFFPPPPPPDNFSGAAVPTGSFRLPSGAVPAEKRGGVAMKADVVKGEAADMSEMFGGESRPASGTQQDGLVCPFLLFCAAPLQE